MRCARRSTKHQLLELLLGGPPTTARIEAMPGSMSSRVAVKARKNGAMPATFNLPSSLRPAGTSGAFAVATRAAGLHDDVRIVSVTDLGVSTKWSPHGGLVWITRLSSGAPVANAHVSLRRAWPVKDSASVASSEVYAGSTDATGIVTIPEQASASFLGTDDQRSAAVLFVREGADHTYALLPSLDGHFVGAIADVFTDRRLYRPGETGFVKGFFRAPTARGLGASSDAPSRSRPSMQKSASSSQRRRRSTHSARSRARCRSRELPASAGVRGSARGSALRR